MQKTNNIYCSINVINNTKYSFRPAQEFAIRTLRDIMARFASSKSWPAAFVPTKRKTNIHKPRTFAPARVRGHPPLHITEEMQREWWSRTSVSRSSHSPIHPPQECMGIGTSFPRSLLTTSLRSRNYSRSEASARPERRRRVTTILSAVQCRPPAKGVGWTHPH